MEAFEVAISLFGSGMWLVDHSHRKKSIKKAIRLKIMAKEKKTIGSFVLKNNC